MKLSKTQIIALRAINKNYWKCAYELKLSLGTLWAMKGKGLVELKRDSRGVWCQRGDIFWRLTDLGLKIRDQC